MHKLIVLFTGFIVFFTSSINSQVPGYTPPVVNTISSDTSNVTMHLNIKSFFKNNEYFNPLNEGYTLLGYVAEPSLIYQPFTNFRIEGGVRLLSYTGRKGIYETEPLFRVQYQPNKWFQMIMGSIYGGEHHRLTEPVYAWELEFTEPFETGLQFLFNTKHFYSDIWLNWQQFILHGDPFQEHFTANFSNGFIFSSADNSSTLTIPLQALFRHHGGQIDSADLPIETLSNFAVGLRYEHRTGNRIFKGWNAELMYYTMADLSPQKLQRYKSGLSVYPKAGISLGPFTLTGGYFWGHDYLSISGEKLMQSATIPYNGISFNHVELITFTFVFAKTIRKGLSLAAYGQTYTSFEQKQTDYNYGVHIFFNSDLFKFKL